MLTGPVASGVGSMPGTDAREAARVVAGELPDLPHLVELPARGPGADLTGRTAALLVDLHADRQPSGWRLVDRAGRDERRAQSWLGEDLDALEEVAQSSAGPLKLQLAGPLTLAATLDLPRGDKALSDAGARRDVVASLAEAVTGHVADVRRRVRGAQVWVQLDEPALPAVIDGRVPTASGFRTLRSVGAVEVGAALRAVVDAVHAAGARAVVHCCAAQPPLALLRQTGADGLSLDLTMSGIERCDDELAGAAEAGLALLLGVVPTSGGDLSEVAATVAPMRALRRRTGLDAEQFVQSVVVTPTCGLAGLSPDDARAALERCREAARVLADDPEG